MIGIYFILNKTNGKVYIGKSLSVSARLRVHLTSLRRGKHFNKHLQSAFNIYGENQFEFKLLEECQETQLADKEQHWIDYHKTTGLYNKSLDVKNIDIDKFARAKISENAKSYIGDNNPFYGKKHSEEAKHSMSNKKKIMYLGESNPNFGIKWDEEKRNKMRGRNSKITIENVLEIKRLLSLGEKHQKIADLFKISRTVVTRISSGTRYGYVKGEIACV